MTIDLTSLGRVTLIEPGCIVPEDPGEVVRGARPITDGDRAQMREQHIARLLAAQGRPR